MQLTPRLQKIADLVPKGTRTLADIGTDHAYLPVYCMKNSLCENALAMDVNEGPLNSAEENIKKYLLSDKISLRLSDGIQGLKSGEADVITIAGMGGLLIKRILEDGQDKILPGTQLLLQPMIAQRELREYLYSDGYYIENEYVVREGNKFYNIFFVVYGKSGQISKEDIIIGRNLKTNSPEVFEDYARYKMRILDKIIKGMEKSETSADDKWAKEEFEVFERSLCDEG